MADNLLAEVERVAKLCEKLPDSGQWQAGTWGHCDLVAYNGEDISGVAIVGDVEKIAAIAALRNLFHSRRAQIVEALREANQRRWQVANWHDLLGSMIAQVGHPDYSLHEMVDGMRKMRDQMFAEITSARKNAP